MRGGGGGRAGEGRLSEALFASGVWDGVAGSEGAAVSVATAGREGVGKSCEAAACKLRGRSALRRAAAAVVGAVRSVLVRGGGVCGAAGAPGKGRQGWWWGARSWGRVGVRVGWGEPRQRRAPGSAESLGRWGERRPRRRSRAPAWRARGQPRTLHREAGRARSDPRSPGWQGAQ